jgi:hypothetical protein
MHVGRSSGRCPAFSDEERRRSCLTCRMSKLCDAASLSDGEETASPASTEACTHPPTEGYAFGRETVVAALKAIGEVGRLSRS